MNSSRLRFFEPGIQAVACLHCQSSANLQREGDHLRCPACRASYPIVDGVLELMPPAYDGYLGDSQEAAVLRDAHNRQTLREDTAHLRSSLAQHLPPGALVLDAGCGTGHLTRMIAEAHPDAVIIAADVSLPMCQLAVRNCSGLSVMVVHTPSTKIPPMPFRNSFFDLVLHRLAPMDPGESFRLLRPGGYAVSARLTDAYWQEIKQVFAADRLILHPRDPDPTEVFFQAGFSSAEAHTWRFTRPRTLEEVVMTLQYAPILRDFDETADRPALDRLAAMYGDKKGIHLTEGEALVICRKGD